MIGKFGQMEIRDLWDCLSQVFPVVKTDDGHECISPDGLCIPSGVDGMPGEVKHFVRHHTKSCLYTVKVDHAQDLVTTDDHTLMVVSRDDKSDWQNHVSRVRCSKVNVGDYMVVNDDPERWVPTLREILSVKPVGNTDDWVYDFEMTGPSGNDDLHTYYANDILVHNSQFVSLEPVVKTLARSKGLDEKTFFRDHTMDFKKEVIKIFDDIIYNEINPFVADLINKTCHTTQGHRLRYSHEYTTDLAYYQAKKCYIVHIMETEGKYVDKWKQSGIRIKKLGIPVQVKGFLKHVYYTTMLDVNFGERECLDYLDGVYNKLRNLSFEEIAQFSNYKTEKQAISFCQSVKGAGGVPRAVNNYNDIIKVEHLTDKYSSIQVGDEIQWVYIDKANKYGIDVIAFKGSFPVELKQIFQVDYYKMFDKLVGNTLRTFYEIMHYTPYAPGLCSKDDLDLL